MAALISAIFCSAAMADPVISKVAFYPKGSSYKVTISGSGFGSAPAGIPCTYCTSPDLFGLSSFAPGFLKKLHFVSWTDSKIIITDLRGEPGDGETFQVVNPATGKFVEWGGNLPGGTAIPIIKSIHITGSGQNVSMDIEGSGLGKSPFALPYSQDTMHFFYVNESAQWEAGYSGGNVSDCATVKFTKWSDKRVVTDGFPNCYGVANIVNHSGDKVLIGVANSHVAGAPWTFRAGILP
jgi:hypothetical protein